MSAIRVDRFLASTAVLLLLSGAAGGAFAEPIADSATTTVPASAETTSATSAATAGAEKAGAKAAPAGNTTASEPDASAPASDAQSPAPSPATPAAEAAPITPAEPAPAAATAETKAPATETPAAAATSTPAASETPATAATTPAAEAPAAPPAATASEPAAPAAQNAPVAPAAATLSSADAPVADQLRELANGKFDHVIVGKKERAQIDAFYSARNYAPLWITDGKANEQAKAAIGYLDHADADGLDPADYAVPNFATLTTPADLADAEIKLSMAVITYAHHASVGRVHWSRVSADISYDRVAPEPGDVLAAMADAKDIAAALDTYEPHTPGYLALKAKLADIRAGKVDKDKPPIANGPVLKVGMQDDRVPQLRERLGVLGDDGTTYDKGLAAAVKKFQQQRDISATGTLTAATVEALNGVKPDHVTDIIIANMERWRWMPHEFPDSYVIVNLPDFTLRVIHDNKLLWMTRIVVGKPEMPTPLMTGEMKYITVNPTWNVPPSIINREYLPALAQDPTVLDRMGLRIGHNPDGSVHIWQPPGDRNALGHIRFNFPNKFLVYQHDTPDKYMFAYDKRAFSHGCMRVQDPAKYAEVLLSLVRPGDGYTEERIKRMFGPNETDIQFPHFMQVNLTYQTAFVDDAGKLEFREDIYGRDRALLAMLKGDDRKVADIPVEHHEDVAHREVMAVPDQPSFFGSRVYGGRGPGPGYYAGGDGDNFFSRLFGGFGSSPPPPPPRRVVSHGRRVTRSGDTVER